MERAFKEMRPKNIYTIQWHYHEYLRMFAHVHKHKTNNKLLKKANPDKCKTLT